MNLFGIIGRKIIDKLDYYGGVIGLTVYSLRELFRPHSSNQNFLVYQNVVKQVYFTSYQAIRSLFFTSILIGISTVFILFARFPGIVPKNVISDIFVLVIFREVMPLIVIVIVIARSVSAIAVEIGNMSVNKEFDILVSMGVDPLFFLTLPRILGMVASFIILIIFASFFILVLSPLFLVLLYDIDAGEIINHIFKSVKISDIVMVLVKGIVCGLFMPSIASYFGFKTYSRNLVPVA
ncbi:MAG: MlaE family ABC transporter permease, partial [Brevinematia bacterium]